MRVHAPLLGFNRGEVSRLALARVDNEKLRLAAESQVNWLPHVLGPMMLRPGLKFLASTRSDAAAKFIPFVFSNSDTALIEITDSHMRIWIDDAVLTAASVSTTITSGTFSASAGWTTSSTSLSAASTVNTSAGRLELYSLALGSSTYAEQSVTVAGGSQNVAHRLRIVVLRGPVTFQIGSTSGGEEYLSRTSLQTGTHSLVFTPTSTPFYVRFSTTDGTTKMVDSITVESSGAVDITAPWTASDLDFIRYAQSGDIVYVACDGFQPRQIERRDNNSWSITLFDFKGGPFMDPDEWAKDILMTPTVAVGTTVTGSLASASAYFKSTHVGATMRLSASNQGRTEHLQAVNRYTKPIRVTGNTMTDRQFGWTISGTWSGTISLERSFDGADTGFLTYLQKSANFSSTINDTADTGAVVANVDTWYRTGFTTYTSGLAQIQAGYSGADGGHEGYGKIVAYNSSTSVDVEWFNVSSASGTIDWKISEWSDENGWPSAIAFHDGRLWFSGGDKLWGSVSDDFNNFDEQTEGDSGPISRSIGVGPIAIINWLMPLTRLIVGCEGSEVSIRSSAFDEPLTPTNFTLKECSTFGSANLPALKVDTRGIFVEKSNRRIYELAYNVQIQDYTARDLTHYNPDIGIPGFTRCAAQRQPDTCLHFLRTDGEAAILVQSAEDGMEAWWRVNTLGVIEDVVILPGTLEDSVYYVVKRTINGSTKRFLEKFAMRSQSAGGSTSRNLDCHLVVSQSSSTAISGLSHLEGETVHVWANGKDLGSYTVSSGAISVSENVTSAIVGLGGVSFSYDSATAATSVTCATKYNGYPAEVYADGKYIGAVAVAAGVATLPNGRTAKKITAYLGFYGLYRSSKLAYGAQMGTALGQHKKTGKVGIIAYDMHYQGLQYGDDIHNMQPLPLTEGGQDTTADTVWTEFDRPMIGLPGTWNADSRLHLLSQAPKPVTVAAALIDIGTNEAR